VTLSGDAMNNPLWTPDARYILFRSPDGIGWMRADGGGAPKTLTQSANTQFPSSISADGKRLMYTEFRSGNLDLYTVPIQSDDAGLHAGQPEVYLTSRFLERDGAFSPDGKWVAYHCDESGTNEIYVRSFPDSGAKVQISNGGGYHAVWSHKGKQLFFHNSQGRLMLASYSVSGDRFVAEKPRPWSNMPVEHRGWLQGGLLSRHYDLAPDETHVIAVVPVTPENVSDNHVTVLLNFFDELRRRAPESK